MKMNIKHPFYDKYISLELDSGTTFSEISAMLIDKGFIKPKKGGYHFIIDDELCRLNAPVSDYLKNADCDSVDILVHGLLSILI